jgi:prepilin-type N-terminal cleavage/methylation domain-containing protein
MPNQTNNFLQDNAMAHAALGSCVRRAIPLREGDAPLGRHAAFTLTEVVVAMAIIAILAGLMLFGMKSISNAAKRNATRVTLQNASGMLTEWLQVMKSDAGALSYLSSSQQISADSVGRVAPDDAGRTGTAVQATAAAFKRFRQAPSAQKMFQQLPPDQLMTEGGWTTILDGWRNPILFVPAGGLYNVSIGSQPNCTITSMAVIPKQVLLWNSGSGYSEGDYVYYPQTSTVFLAQRSISAGGPVPSSNSSWIAMPARPFFASAGPDGDFATGDDNVYSFEN